ncbi:hypothetical protein XJ44_04890 [Thermosipho affectus]|uniref:Polysaccharide biosynthesis protein n=1 Tax=Thermosipho affectus TaxID=660294 RepID=A0ABX3IIU6_9BACT|nr:oligosaccharide flippase family protein [Thermosipho affectus]ONN27129.1 hypothetical protein XJ44_04890 [Thermosipho affectus]
MSVKKSSSILFISKVIKTVFDIASIMLLSRLLFVSDYGIYKQLMLSSQLVISIMILGVPNSALYYLSNKRKKEYLVNLYFTLFFLSILVIIVSPFLAMLFDMNFKVDFFRKNIFIVALIYSLGIFSSASENILVALNKIKSLVIYTIAPTVYWFIGLLFLLFYGKYTIYMIFVLFIFRYVLNIVLLILPTWGEIKFEYTNLKRIKDILIFGIPIGFSTILGMLNKNVDKLVVGYFVDNVNFAIFSNGAYEIPFSSLLTSSLFTVLIPELKRLNDLKNISSIKTLWNRAGNVMIPIMVSLASSLIFFAKPFVLFIFSEKYLASVPYFRIYQTILYFRIYVYGSIFVATKNSRIFLFNAIYSLIFNIAMDIFLIMKIGPIGAVIATVLTTVFLVILQLINIKNILKIKFSETFPWFNWIKSIIVSLMISGSLYVLYDITSSGVFVGLLFMFFSFVLSFFILSYMVNNEVLNYIVYVLKKLTSK